MLFKNLEISINPDDFTIIPHIFTFSAGDNKELAKHSGAKEAWIINILWWEIEILYKPPI